MKLTESYLKRLIKQVINEVQPGHIPNPTMREVPVDPEVIELLRRQGYKVVRVGDTGSYNVIHPTDQFKSFVLEPKIK